MGFDRVVLARELSMEEIRQIAEATNLPLEVFVHGAHCTSVSGNCYLSSMIGGRSGNRGLCAQPCRLDFRLNERSYALSLKDLSVLGSLEQLADAGVTSFKIEGRLKRPEYVAAAVAGCRRSLAGQPADTDQLRALFSRSGFTDGYLMGRRRLEMFGHRTLEDVQASAEALESLSEATPEAAPAIGVDMLLRIADGMPASLTLSDGRHTVTITGVKPQQALEKQLTRELAERSLRKTGGTPFALRQLEAQIESGLTLSVGDLNALRREGLEVLSQCRNPLPVYERSSEDLERFSRQLWPIV
jgi:putative protease